MWPRLKLPDELIHYWIVYRKLHKIGLPHHHSFPVLLRRPIQLLEYKFLLLFQLFLPLRGPVPLSIRELTNQMNLPVLFVDLRAEMTRLDYPYQMVVNNLARLTVI